MMLFIAPHSIAQIIQHELQNSKGHQGTFQTFEAMRRFYLLPKLHQDIVKQIINCDIWAKNLPKVTKYPQHHLEIPHVPMAVLAMDTIKSSTSPIQRLPMGFNSNMHAHIICVCQTNDRKVS